MTILLAIAILALIGLVVYRDLLWEQRLAEIKLARAQERERERARYASLRAEAAEERRELYQRIQAPEIAVHDAQLQRRRERPYTPRKPIGAEDDAAYQARRENGQVNDG